MSRQQSGAHPVPPIGGRGGWKRLALGILGGFGICLGILILLVLPVVPARWEAKPGSEERALRAAQGIDPNDPWGPVSRRASVLDRLVLDLQDGSSVRRVQFDWPRFALESTAALALAALALHLWSAPERSRSD